MKTVSIGGCYFSWNSWILLLQLQHIFYHRHNMFHFIIMFVLQNHRTPFNFNHNCRIFFNKCPAWIWFSFDSAHPVWIESTHHAPWNICWNRNLFEEQSAPFMTSVSAWNTAPHPFLPKSWDTQFHKISKCYVLTLRALHVKANAKQRKIRLGTNGHDGLRQLISS